MNKPCESCPFLIKPPFVLRSGRATEFADCLRRGGPFNCHKTTCETGDGSEQFCTGALLTMENERDGDEDAPGCMANQAARICARLGSFNPNELEGHDRVYNSLEEWADTMEERAE